MADEPNLSEGYGYHTVRTTLATPAYLDWRARLRELHEAGRNIKCLVHWSRGIEIQHVRLFSSECPSAMGSCPRHSLQPVCAQNLTEDEARGAWSRLSVCHGSHLLLALRSPVLKVVGLDARRAAKTDAGSRSGRFAFTARAVRQPRTFLAPRPKPKAKPAADPQPSPAPSVERADPAFRGALFGTPLQIRSKSFSFSLHVCPREEYLF